MSIILKAHQTFLGFDELHPASSEAFQLALAQCQRLRVMSYQEVPEEKQIKIVCSVGQQ
jgi:flagellar biosynthesis component FlhA